MSTDNEREALAVEREEIARIIDGHVDMPVSSRLAIARSLQGNGFRRFEVPEPSAEVLGEWFTSSRGVAVAAVAPMTDRGPSVMVDGRVISPNDVAALIEFKAQGEPSDAQAAEEADRRWPHTPGDPDTASARSARRLSFRQGVEWARAAGVVGQEGEQR